MFDIRARIYTPEGDRGRVIKTHELTISDQQSSSPKLTMTTSTRVAGNLPTPFVVALEYSVGGGRWVEPRNARFLMGDDDGDAAAPAGIMRFTGSGFVPWLFDRHELQRGSGSRDGVRTWTGRSAGYLMGGLINEGRAREWAPLLSYTFDSGFDSLGQAWPMGDYIDHEFSYLTKLSAVLDSLAGSGLAEWWSEGNEFKMVRGGTGQDLTTGPGAVRLGPGATSKPVRTKFGDVFTHLTVVPEKSAAWQNLTNLGADIRFGRLENSLTLSGVKDAATATRMAQPTLEQGRTSQREGSLTFAAQTAKHLPWADFNVGDLVQARLRGSWETLRVVEILVSKNADGEVSVSVTLGYRFRALIARLAGRARAGSAGGLVGGSGLPLPPAGPITLPNPNAPEGLHVIDNVGAFDEASGLAMSRVTVGWAEVTQSTDAAGIDIDGYEVWYRSPGGIRQWVTFTKGLQAAMTLPADAEVLVTIRARSTTQLYSEFSAELSVTPALPPLNIDPPTPPTLVSELGIISILWDGLLVSGAVPAGFRRVFAMYSLDGPTGTYLPAGSAGTSGLVAQLVGLDVGTVAHVIMYSENTLGVSSIPTDPLEATVVGIEMPDVGDTITDAINEAMETANEAKSTADAAAASVNGKNQLWHSTGDPVGDGSSDGDIWHKWTTLGIGGRLLATWRWTVTAGVGEWVATVMDATYIPLLDIGQGTFGALKGDRLESNTVTANKLLIGDFTNLIDDPQFLSPAPSPGWRQGNTDYGLYTIVDSPAGSAWKYELRFMPSETITASEVGFANLNIFTCAPGDKFYVSVGKRTSGGVGSGAAGWYIIWTLADGTYAFSNGYSAGANGTIAATVTAPALAVTGQMRLTVRIGFLGGHAVVFNNPVCRRLNGGELIVDGAVTAAKMNTAEIWANTAWLDEATIRILKAGSIQAQHLAIGAANPNGTQVNRVPRPLTDIGYWGGVVGGSINIGQPYGPSRVAALATGLRMTPGTGSQHSLIYIMAPQPVPESGQIVATCSAASVLGIVTLDAAGAELGIVTAPLGEPYTIPSNAVSYTARLSRYVGSSAITIAAASVFEVIGGNANGQQGTTVSPAGVFVQNDTATVKAAFATSTRDILSIAKQSSGVMKTRASLNEDGAIQLTDMSLVEGGDINASGTPMLGAFPASTVNGGQMQLPFLERLGRGIVARGSMGADPGGISNNATYTALATTSTVLDASRTYRVLVDASFFTNWLSGTTGGLGLEVWIGSSSQSVTAPNGQRRYWSVHDQSAVGYGSFQGNISAPITGLSGRVYILVRLTNSSNRSFITYTTGSTGAMTLSIEDIGPSLSLADLGTISTRVTAGTPPPAAQWTTSEWATTTTRSYRESGSTIVTGGGEYDNASKMYQGNGNTPMGSIAVFPALGLSGKQIRDVWVFLQNESAGYSPFTATMGYSSAASLPGTHPGRANGQDVPWSRGEGKWVRLADALYASIASGAIRSVTLGVDGSNANYARFDGRSHIRVTYR